MKPIAFVCATVLFATTVFGANHYVRRYKPTGTADGADWTRAWSNTSAIDWSRVNPGDTIWIAGGKYAPFAVGAGGSGDARRLQIKRALARSVECSSASGWQPAFDAQVILAVPPDNGARGISIVEKDCITIDGQIADGIAILCATNVGGYTHGIYDQGNSNHFRNIRFEGARVPGNHRAIGLSSYPYPRKGGGVVSHVRCSGVDSFMFIDGYDGATVEYCEVWDNMYSSDLGHGNLMYVAGGASHGTIRYNRFRDFCDQGIGIWGPGSSDDWKIYGNVFSGALSAPSPGIVFGGYAGTPHGNNFFIYNNTFANMQISIRGANPPPGYVSNGGQISNNIFFNAPPLFFVFKHDYNWYSGDSACGDAHGIAGGRLNPFVDSASNDFHIGSSVGAALPRNKGLTLDAEFALDKDGNKRGADGAWDIGAYEWGQGLPASPGNVRATR